MDIRIWNFYAVALVMSGQTEARLFCKQNTPVSIRAIIKNGAHCVAFKWHIVKFSFVNSCVRIVAQMTTFDVGVPKTCPKICQVTP